ncbi:MAG: hypothetical protein GC184_06825 [Rhizobiales bacterium]|nr:hypothetical protein [Hyphomicrobiales bacterium]
MNQKLTEYLSTLPTKTVVKLASGLERERMRGTQGLPYREILEGLRPILAKLKGPRPGKADPIRKFCQPFEDLLVNEHSRYMPQGQIQRATIMRVWRWLEKDLLPDAMPDLARRIIDHTLKGDQLSLDASVAVLHATTAAAIREALAEARKDVAMKRRIEEQLGGESGLEDVSEIADVLDIAPLMLTLQESLPRKIADFDEGMISVARDLYEAASEMAPDSALYIPFAVMSRLTDSWQILRLARRIAHQRNDMLISRSEMAVLGEMHLVELEDITQSVETLRPGHIDLDDLLKKTERFVRVSKGFTGEIDIRRYGEWGQRVLAARARMSAVISQEISRFENELNRALPLQQIGAYGRGAPLRPDVARAPDELRVARARKCLHFLHGAIGVTESIGALSHCKSVLAQITTYLASYEDRLLEEIRNARGPERAHAQLYLDIVAGFRDELGAADEANVLRRRAAIAAQG